MDSTQQPVSLDEDSLIKKENPDAMSDDWIFSSEAFCEGDEYIACIGYFQQISVNFSTQQNKYQINTRYIKHPDQDKTRKTILFTHGHSTDSNWVTWIKAAVFLWNCGFDAVLIDLPGFGKSLINDKIKVHFKNWLEDGPNMIKEFLNQLQIQKVSCCGFCGGGALLIRTIAAYPELFDTHHVFYNLIISAFPDKFENIIQMYKFNIKVFWNPDVDHPIYSVSYKYLKAMNKKNNKNIKLINITNDDLLSSGLWAKGYGRANSDYLFIFLPDIKFLSFLNSFYYENINDY